MKTKNIFRTLLMAAFLLAGANIAKADIIYNNAGGTSQYEFSYTDFAKAAGGDKLRITYTIQPQDNWTPTYKVILKDRWWSNNLAEAAVTANGTVELTLTDEMFSGGSINTTDQYNRGAVLIGEWVTITKIELVSASGASSKTDVTLAYSAATALATLGQSFTAPVLTSSVDGLTIVYSSSNPEVATIDSNGAVALVGAGTTVITATFDGDDNYNSASASYTLMVMVLGDNDRLIYENTTGTGTYEFSYTDFANVAGGDKLRITYNVQPQNGWTPTYKVVLQNWNWNKVLSETTVSDSGALEIELTDDMFTSGDINTTDPYNRGAVLIGEWVNITSIVLSTSGSVTPSKTDVTLTYSSASAETTTASIGETLANAPMLTVSPEGLEGITYSSSNTNVATVATDGTVTIVGAGTTVITATFEETDTYNGASASYTLTVSKLDVTMSFSEEAASAKMEQPFTPPTLTVSPDGLEGITYSSSNSDVATVDNNGNVTLVAPGVTVITASFAETAVYNSASASYTLTVAEADVPTFTVAVSEPANGQISVSPTTDVIAGTTVTINATPYDGYKLYDITVTGDDGSGVDVYGSGNTRTFTMPSQNVTISATFAEIEKVTATISSSTGLATFCSDKALDFTGITTIEAYYATTVEIGNVYLLRVYGTVAAGTGLIIKGSTTSIPVADSGEYLSGNLLIGVTSDTEVNAATDYVLTEKNGAAVFAQTGVKAATVAAGHAYLRVSAAQARAFSIIGLGGEGTTGIENTFVDDNEAGEKVIYNLNGQRVKNPTKGLYIINGKKVLVK